MTRITGNNSPRPASGLKAATAQPETQTLTPSREFAHNILATIREPFLVLDKKLHVVSANPSFYQVFRVTPEETEGRFVYDLGDGQWNIPRLRELLEEVLPQNHTFDDFEVEHDFESVGRKTMLLNARRVREPGESFDLILLAIEDITERKRSAEGVSRHTNQFETLLKQAPIGVYMLDADFRIRHVNPATFQVFGDIPDLIGRDFVEVIHILWHKEYADEIIRRFRHTLETGEPYISPQRMEERLDRRETESYEWQVNRILLADGRFGVVCYFQDISARVFAEQSLRHSEVRYRRLFQTAKDGILILNAESGKIIDANAFMSGLVGLDPNDLLGKELHEIGMFKDIDENKEAFRELQRTGYLRHEHLPVVNQRGERVEVEFIANIYYEGEHLVAQCNVRDISERVEMESKIKQQAEALADESRRKDEFLAMLSHELRNPLAPIRSAMHLLKTQARESESVIQQQAREIVERQVANLTKLVSDLLEVSRVVTGRIRLDRQLLDLKQVVQHGLQTAAPLFGKRRHKVTLNLCSEPVWVQADPTRMDEVLVNLLNNAAKYTPDGGDIQVHCEHLPGENYAVVRVLDNGVGLDEKLIQGGRVFDLFTQADRSLDRSEGGLGIGLSLVHRLVGLHGGTVEAKSDGPGKGSEFIVRLPLVASPSESLDSSLPTPELVYPEKDAARYKAHGKRVIVVDDNVDLVTMLVGFLRQQGFTVQSAYTGPDGLNLARQWRADIVLLDIGLPGMDGYEVARRLRAADAADLPQQDTPRLIALTGYGRESDIALAHEAGFDAHLVKPYDFEELEKLMVAGEAEVSFVDPAA